MKKLIGYHRRGEWNFQCKQVLAKVFHAGGRFGTRNGSAYHVKRICLYHLCTIPESNPESISKLKAAGIDVDSLPEFEGRSFKSESDLEQMCVVCAKRNKAQVPGELHHFYPDHVARKTGEDSYYWPTAYLCKKHHWQWHREVDMGIFLTPDASENGRRLLQKLKPKNQNEGEHNNMNVAGFAAQKSKYLKNADLKGQARSVTVEKAGPEPVGSEVKVVVWFKGIAKGLPLNVTNLRSFIGLFGEDTDQWEGHQVTLMPLTVPGNGQFAGQMLATIQIQGLAVAPPAPPGKRKGAQPPPVPSQSVPEPSVATEDWSASDDDVPF